MTPVIALVGRPNVGKSTLFNRLTRSRDALVANHAGLTRDRQYGHARLGERDCTLVDTGGMGESEDEGVARPMGQQARSAVAEADLVLWLVDGRAGLTTGDEQLADELRRLDKPVHLAVNKTDGLDEDVALAEFFSLGFSRLHPVSATHGRGTRQLAEALAADFPPLPEASAEDDEAEEAGIRLAVLGRPNAGKSTLVNRLLGEDRVVVHEDAGTTRDAIEVRYERRGETYTLIDTAGVRRRGRVNEAVEKFSVIQALRAVDQAQVVILVIDAREGITDQDLHLLGMVLDAGRALVVAVNKWDGLSADQKARNHKELDRRLDFVPWAHVQPMSALHGTGVGDLYPPLHRAWVSAFPDPGTNRLNRILRKLVQAHQPPLVGRHRIKLRYAHPGGTNPPVIVVHGNQAEAVPGPYRRYLENGFREALQLEGTPLRVELRGGDNPYAHKPNPLSARQLRRRKRLMRHVKR